MTDLDVRLRQRLAMTVPATPDGRDLTKALAAVLDLHQPVHDHMPECSHCYGMGDVTNMDYPCPTVRAIAGKLGVEVDGG